MSKKPIWCIGTWKILSDPTDKKLTHPPLHIALSETANDIAQPPEKEKASMPGGLLTIY